MPKPKKFSKNGGHSCSINASKAIDFNVVVTDSRTLTPPISGENSKNLKTVYIKMQD